MSFGQPCNPLSIKLLDHRRDQVNCLIVIISVNDACVAVDVPGRHSNHKVWYPAAVEVNRP
jgi:hypothetical protein